MAKRGRRGRSGREIMSVPPAHHPTPDHIAAVTAALGKVIDLGSGGGEWPDERTDLRADGTGARRLMDAIADLERAINPARLAWDDPRRGGISFVGWGHDVEIAYPRLLSLWHDLVERWDLARFVDGPPWDPSGLPALVVTAAELAGLRWVRRRLAQALIPTVTFRRFALAGGPEDGTCGETDHDLTATHVDVDGNWYEPTGLDESGRQVFRWVDDAGGASDGRA